MDGRAVHGFNDVTIGFMNRPFFTRDPTLNEIVWHGLRTERSLVSPYRGGMGCEAPTQNY